MANNRLFQLGKGHFFLASLGIIYIEQGLVGVDEEGALAQIQPNLNTG